MSVSPIVIGFCGLAGSGKTTAAEYLVREHGFERLAFAGPLKAMVRALGLSAREMAGDLKEEPCPALCGKSPRQFMQLLGTEFGRQMIGEDFWVETWRRRVEYEAIGRKEPLRIVADDVRFPNEVSAIRALGGRIINVQRASAGSATGARHVSETTPLSFDAVCKNDGSHRELHSQTADALKGVIDLD